MKISLKEQIAEAETHRDGLHGLMEIGGQPPGVNIVTRLHRSEGIVLTLRWLETYEIPFRAFMAERSK